MLKYLVDNYKQKYKKMLVGITAKKLIIKLKQVKRTIQEHIKVTTHQK